MSSCFLCDCSYVFTYDDLYNFFVKAPGEDRYLDTAKFMKCLPIMFSSPGAALVDQQHDGFLGINYLSYRVQRIEFRFTVEGPTQSDSSYEFPDYFLIFKVPFRDPIVDYEFELLENFMLYSEPESVLSYKIIQCKTVRDQIHKPNTRIKIEINKSFILGPRDYLGVFYMTNYKKVDASAKVWFDIA